MSLLSQTHCLNPVSILPRSFLPRKTNLSPHCLQRIFTFTRMIQSPVSWLILVVSIKKHLCPIDSKNLPTRNKCIQINYRLTSSSRFTKRNGERLLARYTLPIPPYQRMSMTGTINQYQACSMPRIKS